jgi:hypothetical protein
MGKNGAHPNLRMRRAATQLKLQSFPFGLLGEQPHCLSLKLIIIVSRQTSALKPIPNNLSNKLLGFIVVGEGKSSICFPTDGMKPSTQSLKKCKCRKSVIIIVVLLF